MCINIETNVLIIIISMIGKTFHGKNFCAPLESCESLVKLSPFMVNNDDYGYCSVL